MRNVFTHKLFNFVLFLFFVTIYQVFPTIIFGQAGGVGSGETLITNPKTRDNTVTATVPDIIADLIYTGSLRNSGENIILKSGNNIIDQIDFSTDWPETSDISTTLERDCDNLSIWEISSIHCIPRRCISRFHCLPGRCRMRFGFFAGILSTRSHSNC